MYGFSAGRALTPAIKNLLLANIAVFLVQYFIAYNLNDMLSWFIPDSYPYDFRSFPSGGITAFDLLFGLVPNFVITRLYVWQFVSYMFLHANFWHIFMNMFILWMFGSELERTWGTKEFVRYYFLTGVVAGFANFLANFGSFGVTIGASGAVFGILAAYALFFPENEVYIWGIIPVKSKYLVVFLGVVEFMALPSQDNIAHVAHLGGMVAGFFYLRHRYRHWGIGQNFFRDFFKKKDRW